MNVSTFFMVNLAAFSAWLITYWAFKQYEKHYQSIAEQRLKDAAKTTAQLNQVTKRLEKMTKLSLEKDAEIRRLKAEIAEARQPSKTNLEEDMDERARAALEAGKEAGREAFLRHLIENLPDD